MNSKGKWLKGILWTVTGLFALFVLLMVGIQIALSPKVCTSLVLKYSPEFIDGKLSLEKASVSVFSHFPAVTLDIDDFVVTYPSRYPSDSSGKVDNLLEWAGSCAHSADSLEGMDTLCSFEKLSVSVNVLSLLNGNVRIKNLEFQKPRAYIHVYSDSTSNLDVLKLPPMGQSTSDTSSFVIHNLLVKKLFIGSRSYIVYTDRRSGIYSLLYVQRIGFRGKVSALDPLAHRFELGMDTVFVTGNYKSDTLLFGLNHLGINNSKRKLDFDVSASAYAATRAFGRVKIPLTTAGSLRISDIRPDSFRACLDNFTLDCDPIHANAGLEAVVADTIALKGFLELPSVDVQSVMNRLSDRLMPDLALFLTDAGISARADIDGYYVPGMKGLPGMKLKVDVPLSHVGVVGTDFVPELELHASAAVRQCGDVGLNVSKCCVKAPGIDCNLHGSASDVLGKDPKISLNLGLSASLKETFDKFGKILGISGAGDVKATANGTFKLSDLNIYKLGDIEVDSQVDVSGLDLSTDDDSLKLYCNKLSLALGKDYTMRGKKPLFGAKVDIDSLLCLCVGAMQINGRGVEATASAMPQVIDVSDSVSYFPLRLALNMDRFYVQDMDSNSFRIRSTRNVAELRPDRGRKAVPLIRIMSSNERIRCNTGPHRLSLKGLGFSASARMVGEKSRKHRFNAFRDSLLNRHPEWNDDSLLANFRRNAAAGQIPEWLSESDFRKSDFQFDLGSTTKAVLNAWNFNGTVNMDRARISTPAFPLKTSLTQFKGSFDNDNISLDTLRLVSGASDVEASGKISKLRNALLGRGIPKVRLEIRSDTLAFNELMSALANGQANMEEDLSSLASMSDEKFDSFVEDKQEEVLSEDAPKLIVVPANLDAEIKMRGRGMRYSDLDIYSYSADLIMRHRVLQARNISARSNAGNVSLEAFYSSLTKKKLTTGFDLTLSDVSASQIISLMPDVDSLMPLLKSFDGMLNCNIAATASLDTNMNVILPTLDGVMRISGNNLHFNNDKQVEKVMRRLLFRKPKEAKVDSMIVEGILNDNQLEIFPFLLKMDRWSVSIAGIQNLDKTFSYHASLIKSPLVIKLGATIYGDDFDHIKFKLGKPLFRKEQAIPSFSAAIDTTRLNLVQNIRTIFDRGVEAALRENSRRTMLRQDREKQHYLKSASLEPLEELSASDKAMADSLSTYNQEETMMHPM